MAIKIPEVRGSTAPVGGGRLTPSATPVGLPKTEQAAIGLATNIFEKERKDAHNLRMSEAGRSLNGWGIDNVYDSVNGYRGRLGKDALAIPDEFEENYETFVQEQKKALSNDAQRAEFDVMAEAHRVRYSQWIGGHVNTQIGVMESLEYNAALESSKTVGAQSAVNVPAARESLNFAVASRGEKLGWTDPVIATEQKKQGIELYERSINELMVVGELQEADALLAEGKELYGRDAFSKDLRTRVKQNNANSKASALVIEAFDRVGPTNDRDPAEQDKITAYITARTSDKDALKMANQKVKERITIRDKSIAARDEANTSAVWLKYDATGTTGLFASQEFLALSGTDQQGIRDKIDGYTAADERAEKAEDKEALRIDQDIEADRLADPRNRNELLDADLGDMLRSGEIGRRGHASLIRQRDPLSAPATENAFTRLRDAKVKRLFDSQDLANNSKQWALYNEMVQEFVVNDPKGDVAEFVDKIMAPVEASTTQHFMDIFSFGTPGTEQAVEEKRAELQAEAAGEAPILAPEPSAASRDEAVKALEAAGHPVTEANIQYTIDRL